MLLKIHTMYFDYTVRQSMSTEIHILTNKDEDALMNLDDKTVCQSTHNISINIHGTCLDLRVAYTSMYFMSIEILCVDQQLCLTAYKNTIPINFT